MTTQSSNTQLSYWMETIILYRLAFRVWKACYIKFMKKTRQSLSLAVAYTFRLYMCYFIGNHRALNSTAGKSMLTFALLTPVKSRGVLGKMSQSEFQAQSRTQPLTYFWRVAARCARVRSNPSCSRHIMWHVMVSKQNNNFHTYPCIVHLLHCSSHLGFALTLIIQRLIFCQRRQYSRLNM